MATIRLDLAYDGTDFHGWARQPRHRTVEGEILRVLDRVLGHAPRCSVAGRTDAGVHAERQVVSFEADADPQRLASILNARLSPEIVVRCAQRARDGFDARFDAVSREYRYRIELGPVTDPFTGRYVWHRPKELSLTRMRAAAAALVGEHDFASFGRATSPDGTTVRRLERLVVARTGDRIEITARADAFLRQMVRSLVGTLVDVGEGRIDPAAMPEVLDAGDRGAAGRVAPPHGLILRQVRYRSALPTLYRRSSEASRG